MPPPTKCEIPHYTDGPCHCRFHDPASYGPPMGCLLHSDFHLMGEECWDHVFGWYFDHQLMTGRDRRDLYQATVEKNMLAQLRTDK